MIYYDEDYDYEIEDILRAWCDDEELDEIEVYSSIGENRNTTNENTQKSI